MTKLSPGRINKEVIYRSKGTVILLLIQNIHLKLVLKFWGSILHFKSAWMAFSTSVYKLIHRAETIFEMLISIEWDVCYIVTKQRIW